MTFPMFGRLSVTLALLATSATFLGCGQSQPRPEAPQDEFRRREPAWISGEIMGVDRVPIDQYNDSTVHLLVTTETQENVRLELGPGWYLDENGLTFEPQQHIEFRGQHDPNGGYVAHSLRRGSQTIEIRNSDGSPRWPNKGSTGSGAQPTNAVGSPASNEPAPATPATATESK